MFYILGAGANNKSSIVMLIVLAVLMVGMMLLSVIPQKKRQKKAQEMMNSIKVGTKVKTIGGFVGTIKGIDNQANTFVLDLSAKEDGSTMVVLDKSAIYTVMTPNVEGVLEEAKPAEEQVIAADEVEAEEKLEAKKAEKKAKKNAKKEAEVVEVVAEDENAEVVDAEVVETEEK